jgi:CMP-N-acetylneuraminic acid synthetase
MKVMAIIPARGGSKGVPGKNTYPIDGKPLISYTIEAALESNLLKTIIVTSDDINVRKIAESYKGISFHERPCEISGDKSLISETIDAVLKEFDPEKSFDAFMLLQPTSPIRTSLQIDTAINLFAKHSEANSLISVCEMHDVHPARMYWKDGISLIPILSEFEQTMRQDIPGAFFRNGSIYLTRISAFNHKHSVMIKPSICFEMPASHLLNIDEPRDIFIAEALIKAWKDQKI